MPKQTNQGDELNPREIAKRRDQALMKALSMPPKPHAAPKAKKGGGTRKRRRTKDRSS